MAGEDLAWFFEVYARRGALPNLVITDQKDNVVLEWQDVGDLDFPMPIPVRVNGDIKRIRFTDNRTTLYGVSSRDIQVDPYMQVLRKLSIVPTCEERRAEEADE